MDCITVLQYINKLHDNGGCKTVRILLSAKALLVTCANTLTTYYRWTIQLKEIMIPILEKNLFGVTVTVVAGTTKMESKWIFWIKNTDKVW